jgi:oligopeptide transport system ATP-binding protein
MLLDVRNLKTYFETREGPLKAVDGISYDVNRGEIVALVGESGCGKTVSALSLIRLIPEPPGHITGEAWLEGEDLLAKTPDQIRRIRGHKIAVVFQEPMTSLNPVFNIGRQLREGMLQHKVVDKNKVDQECIRLLELVGIANGEYRLKQYPGQFSGGMRQRVMLAIALACNPSLIIADEPTTALDVTIQAQLLELLNDIVSETQSAVLLITHNLGVVAKYASRVNVMYAGRIIERGTVDEIFYEARHPYTQALLRCVPRLDMAGERLVTLDGQPPNLAALGSGCPFQPRCDKAQDRCRGEWPAIEQFTTTHSAACFYMES